MIIITSSYALFSVIIIIIPRRVENDNNNVLLRTVGAATVGAADSSLGQLSVSQTVPWTNCRCRRQFPGPTVGAADSSLGQLSVPQTVRRRAQVYEFKEILSTRETLHHRCDGEIRWRRRRSAVGSVSLKSGRTATADSSRARRCACPFHVLTGRCAELPHPCSI